MEDVVLLLLLVVGLPAAIALAIYVFRGSRTLTVEKVLRAADANRDCNCADQSDTDPCPVHDSMRIW